MSAQNTTAQTLRMLHKPGNPLILANVYDAITAKTAAAIPTTNALATASWSIAAAAGIDDSDLDLDTNLRAVKAVATIARKFDKPLTADFQDGYGDKLESGVRQLVALGVVGVNLEDTNSANGALYSTNEASIRIERVLRQAALDGIPDFVINARTDTLLHGGTIEDAIERGRAYLAAGAFNVFVWGGSSRGGLSRSEVERLTEAFEGKLNVMVNLAPGNLTVKQLGSIGVARCSVGPALQFPAAEAFAQAAIGYMSS